MQAIDPGSTLDKRMYLELVYYDSCYTMILACIQISCLITFCLSNYSQNAMIPIFRFEITCEYLISVVVNTKQFTIRMYLKLFFIVTFFTKKFSDRYTMILACIQIFCLIPFCMSIYSQNVEIAIFRFEIVCKYFLYQNLDFLHYIFT